LSQKEGAGGVCTEKEGTTRWILFFLK
jgi:hypothetical protein